jgi:hypothetical protein
LDGSIWGNKSIKQVHEDDSAFLKLFPADSNPQTLTTSTPYLLQFGPVYDYIDGEEFSKIVLEFQTSDSYKIFKKTISVGPALTYNRAHTLALTLSK